jgi:NADH-quinone oxidoreductase subunit M
MMILVLILVLIAGGLLAWLAGRRSRTAPRWISLGALGIDLVIVVALWIGHSRSLGALAPAAGGREAAGWIQDLEWSWIQQIGIGFHLAADGLSIVLIALTVFLGILAVAC